MLAAIRQFVGLFCIIPDLLPRQHHSKREVYTYEKTFCVAYVMGQTTFFNENVIRCLEPKQYTVQLMVS